MSTTKRSFGKKIGIGFFVILMILLSAEIQLRIWHYFDPSFIYFDQSYNWFRGKPHSQGYDFKLNSLGFKDIEYPVEKPEGIHRILGIGASFAFGVIPYQHNYLTLLEDELNAESKRYEVINMGIPGIGPNRYGSVLVNEGLQFDPDTIIVNFFVGNAFLASERHRQLHTYSYLASLVRYLIKTREDYAGMVIHKSEQYDDDKPSLSDAEFYRIEASRVFQFEKDNTDFDALLASAVDDLEKIKRVCDKEEIRMILMIIPDSVQVHENIRMRTIRTAGKQPQDYDFDLPNRKLSKALEASGIEIIDTTSALRDAAPSGLLYKPNNTHWNIAGNRVAASELAGLLSR